MLLYFFYLSFWLRKTLFLNKRVVGLCTWANTENIFFLIFLLINQNVMHFSSWLERAKSGLMRIASFCSFIPWEKNPAKKEVPFATKKLDDVFWTPLNQVFCFSTERKCRFLAAEVKSLEKTSQCEKSEKLIWFLIARYSQVWQIGFSLPLNSRFFGVKWVGYRTTKVPHPSKWTQWFSNSYFCSAEIIILAAQRCAKTKTTSR